MCDLNSPKCQYFDQFHTKSFTCDFVVEIMHSVWYVSVFTECPNGTYGPGCQLACQCSTNHAASCDHVTGTCRCMPGYEGRRCERPCQAGHYGPDCGRRCACENEARCDHVTGRCACVAGWTGPGCRHPCAPGSWGPGCNQVRHRVRVVLL